MTKTKLTIKYHIFETSLYLYETLGHTYNANDYFSFKKKREGIKPSLIVFSKKRKREKKKELKSY